MEWCTRSPSQRAFISADRASYAARMSAYSVSAGTRGHHLGGEHGVAPRGILEGGVGVPEAVAEGIHAATVVGLHDVAALVEVRDVAEGLVAEPILLQRADAERGVEDAVEALGELEVLVVGEGLVAEHEDGELIHAGAEAGQRLLIVHASQIDGTHLGDEQRMQLAEREPHGAVLPRSSSVMGGLTPRA